MKILHVSNTYIATFPFTLFQVKVFEVESKSLQKEQSSEEDIGQIARDPFLLNA